MRINEDWTIPAVPFTEDPAWKLMRKAAKTNSGMNHYFCEVFLAFPVHKAGLNDMFASPTDSLLDSLTRLKWLEQFTGGKIYSIFQFVSHTNPSYDFKGLKYSAWTAFTKFIIFDGLFWNTKIQFPFNVIALKKWPVHYTNVKIKHKSRKSYRFVMTWVSEWGQNIFLLTVSLRVFISECA